MITLKDARQLCGMINNVKRQRGETTLHVQRRNGYTAIDEYSGNEMRANLLCGTTKECFYFLKGVFYEQ